MNNMFSLLSRVVQYVSYTIRHTVLEYAHPTPRVVRIYPGEVGSLYRAMVMGVMNVCELSHMTVVETPVCSRPTMWIDNEAPISGCITICRYIGRHWRLLPVNPATCATVDSSLELLQSFVYPLVAETFTDSQQMGNHVAVFASLLENSFENGETDHLNGFESDTLADVCWSAVWKHVMVDGVNNVDEEKYPNLYAWMEHRGIVEGVFVDSSEEEEEGGDKKYD